ncbi:hypothetical protein DL765_002614 [Monosporascus sp. GIB2]|nr:hypothetical protein DL765_002614 [Monosporascus sp. GIB2]
MYLISTGLDTGCSASLYGLHVAVAALKAGECESAIAAGVNLVLTPEPQVAARKAGIISRTSTCHTFDTLADGYGRAEVTDGHPASRCQVKSNLGHSEAASGLTSLIKIALAFQKGLIPPTRGVNETNPKPASRKSLETRTAQVAQLVERCDSGNVGRLTHTLTQRRSRLRARSYVLVKTEQGGSCVVRETGLSENLEEARGADLAPFAFVFTGQGAQYAGMAKDLFGNEVFRSTIRELDEVLQRLPPEEAPKWTLEQALLGPPETCQIHRVSRSQPVCTAVQIALVNMLRTWGVGPSAVIGHSSGEIAAAYAAGIHSASQAIIIAYYRGFAADQLQNQGAMLAVGLGLDDANGLIQSMGLSGRVSASAQALEVEMQSTVGHSGDELSILDTSFNMPRYWRDNLEKPVQFSAAMMRLIARRDFHLIEIGPHAALKGPINQIRAYANIGTHRLPYTPSLIRGQNAELCMKRLAGKLFMHGHELQWHRVNGISECSKAPFQDLPAYPWDYSGGLLWFEPRTSMELRNRLDPHHELLGSQQLGTNGTDWSWRNILSLDELPWLRDHKVEDQIVFPASCYLAMAMEAVSRIRGLRDTSDRGLLTFEFSNVSLNTALVLHDRSVWDVESTELHTMMAQRRLSARSLSADVYDFNISSWTAGRAVVDFEDVQLSLYTGRVSKDTESREAQIQRHPVLRVNWKPDITHLSPAAEAQLNEVKFLINNKDSISETHWKLFPHRIISLVGERGIVITTRTEAALASLAAAGFIVIVVREQVLLAIREPQMTGIQSRSALLVTHDPSPAVVEFTALLKGHLEQNLGIGQAKSVPLAQLDSTEITGTAICISLVEIEHAFLATMTQEEIELLRVLTRAASNILWLTGANMLAGLDPNLTLVNGFARALMMEQPSLKFAVMDVGPSNRLISNMPSICDNIGKAIGAGQGKDDKEFTQANGLLYISRFYPDTEANTQFRRRLNMEDSIQKRDLAAVRQAKLSIGEVGGTDTLHFQELCDPPTDPPPGFVDVTVQVVSLNAKDVYGMAGIVETRTGTSALEFGGVITAVGPDVKELEPGDRVVVAAPNTFSTTERVPAWSAQKLLPGEDLTVIASLLVAYATALYALRNRANLRAGESILIHSGAGAFGMAAIVVAQHIGATVYTTVSSTRRREFLISELGLPDSNIFYSRDESFVGDLKTATSGRGVDVVVNSLVGDLMHASWDCVANFGRFIEVGKRELLDAGKLDMRVFLRNVTFTAFDLSELFYSEDQSHRDTYTGLLKDVLNMYRSGQIKPAPITTFSAADISKAYRYFSSRERIGKIAISLGGHQDQVPVTPSRYQTILDPRKAYLLVGCLGGLGRSLSGWMFNRGARRFIFLGRSGTEKADAKQFVSRLERAGAHVTVIRGDVSRLQDVNAAVAACTSSGHALGGIVQAAMALHEDLFDRMRSESWHECVRPKWAGTWNLHHAIEGKDDALDFFLLTSSMNGSVGVATETNYCAANTFLDAFARWRRSQGKVAVSVGLGMISEVGVLHENPRIEALLLRRGIHPLNEDEFLQVIDLAISDTSTSSSLATSHLLTGMEPMGVFKLLDQGFDVTHTVMDDPPSSILAAAFEVLKDVGKEDTRGNTSTDHATALLSWLKPLPQDGVSVLMKEMDSTSLRDSIAKTIGQRFSSLILIPIDQVDNHKPFAQYGVDSMIASEFRTWLWNTFQVDIPFLDLTPGSAGE